MGTKQQRGSAGMGVTLCDGDIFIDKPNNEFSIEKNSETVRISQNAHQ
jgi:hypothetical protein